MGVALLKIMGHIWDGCSHRAAHDCVLLRCCRPISRSRMAHQSVGRRPLRHALLPRSTGAISTTPPVDYLVKLAAACTRLLSKLPVVKAELPHGCPCPAPMLGNAGATAHLDCTAREGIVGGLAGPDERLTRSQVRQVRWRECGQ